MPDIFIAPKGKPAGIKALPVNDEFNEILRRKGIKTSHGAFKALSAFVKSPEDLHFETQGSNEQILLLLRRHWITNLGWILMTAILIKTPLFLLPFALEPINAVFNLSAPAIAALVFFWYLVTFSYALVNFILWYFNVGIITNERVIDIDFSNILHKNFAATTISKLEDVTTVRGGVIQTLFDFGNIYAQTAATQAQFEFLKVPHPEAVVRLINLLMGKAEEEK